MKAAHLLLLISFILKVFCGEFDFTVEIPAGKFQCFFQPVDFEKHKTMEVDYQVIDGGDLNINFMLLLGADVLAQDSMKTDGSHKIPLTATADYQICFDNAFSYQAKKVVFFEIFLFDANGQLEELDLAKLNALPNAEQLKKYENFGISAEKFHVSAQKIKSELNKVEYHQSLQRAHEARDRAIMAANLDRVTFWSVVNAAVLILVACVQVWMIRSLFEHDSKVGRMLRKN